MKKKNKKVVTDNDENLDNGATEEQEEPEFSDEDKKEIEMKKLMEILSDSVNIIILKKLRQGPIHKPTLHKLLKAKNKKLPKNPKDYLDKLIELGFVRDYEFEKTLPDPDEFPNLFPQINVGDKNFFYILIKDFFCIRKPSMEILNQIQYLNVDRDKLLAFRKNIELFFNKYTNIRNTGDDPDVIEAFTNPELYLTLQTLSEKIYTYDELTNKLDTELHLTSKKILPLLKKKNFIEFIQGKKSDDKYVILKTDIEVDCIFPEYLLRNMNQLMAEKKLNKEFALYTLNTLKRFYLESEKPDILAEYQENIDEVQTIFDSYFDEEGNISGSKPKKVKKIYQELRALHNKVGDIEKIKELDEKMKEVLK